MKLNMGADKTCITAHFLRAKLWARVGKYDIVFAPLNFLNMYEDAARAGVTVISLRDVLF